MIFMKIFFAVLIIICAIFYVMYLWNFALVLLVVMIALPVIMFVTTYITKRLIDVEFAVKSESVAKRESFPIQIKVNNGSIFPIGKAEAHIEYCNGFNGELSYFTLFMPIQARNTQSVSFQLSSKFCGMVTVRCAYITIYDPLKIFKFKVGQNISTDIAVMPEGHDITGQVSYTDRVNEESSVYSEYKPGDDPSEVFDLRGYNPGDKLNRIHWKLSSKKDEFIVKDYSLPVDIPCTIFLDLRCMADPKFTLPVSDTLVEAMVSVSRFMIDNERTHSVVYYNERAERFLEFDVTDTDSLAEVIQGLILSLNGSRDIPTPAEYFADNSGLSLSSFVFITSDADPGLMEYIDESIDADIKNAIVVTTSPEEAAALGAVTSDVNVIPVVIGRISASIKDIEV